MQESRALEAPSLGWWSHTWRTLLCLLISGVVWVQYAPRQWADHQILFWLDLVVGLAAYVAMFYRRRWPLPVAVAVNAASLLSGVATGPATLTLVSLATRRVYWQIVAAAVVGLGAGWGYVLIEPRIPDESWWVTLTFAVVATVAMIAVGLYVGSRRELLWTLRERARQAEEQQELRMTSARSAERERIAREMHDVLAHRISMVSMHAGALAFRDDLPPEQVRESAALIQTTAHQALTELREVLGVLREDPAAQRDRPQPTLRDLPGLVAEARENGMVVDLAIDLDAEAGLPDQVGRTAYRIAQEGLTNAFKHAAGARVEVTVSGSVGDGLDVRVRNPRGFAQDTPGSGLGLVGLRERAELAGGLLDVGAGRDDFVLRAWLPWPESP